MCNFFVVWKKRSTATFNIFGPAGTVKNTKKREPPSTVPCPNPPLCFEKKYWTPPSTCFVRSRCAWTTRSLRSWWSWPGRRSSSSWRESGADACPPTGHSSKSCPNLSVLCNSNLIRISHCTCRSFIYLANRDFRISCKRFVSGIRCFFDPGIRDE